MAYIDLDYYKNTWKGTDPQDDNELTKLIDRASDIIDMLTRNRIIVFDDLHDSQQVNVKKATAAQTEFFVNVGENYNDDDSVKSAKIGSFSYGSDSGKESNSMSNSISKLTRQYLYATGLAYAGVITC